MKKYSQINSAKVYSLHPRSTTFISSISRVSVRFGLFLVTTLCLMTMVSCDKDDEGMIEGHYRVITSEVLACPAGEEHEEEIISHSETNCQPSFGAMCNYLELSFVAGVFSYDQTIVEGDQHLNQEGGGTYSQSSSRIIICQDGVCVTFTKHRVDNNIELHSEAEEVFDGCESRISMISLG